MPVIRDVIYRREAAGWTPIERFDRDAPLAAERRVDELRAALARTAFRLWVFTTAGRRLLRDTEEE